MSVHFNRNCFAAVRSIIDSEFTISLDKRPPWENNAADDVRERVHALYTKDCQIFLEKKNPPK